MIRHSSLHLDILNTSTHMHPCNELQHTRYHSFSHIAKEDDAYVNSKMKGDGNATGEAGGKEAKARLLQLFYSL